MAGRKARTEQERAQRRQTLIAAARELLEQRPLQDITIAQVAATAGVAKGTTYLYFRTREELFSLLLTQEMIAWREHLERALAQLYQVGAEQLSLLLAESLLQRPILVELMRWAHAILEQNLSKEAALRFRSQASRMYQELGLRVEEAFEALEGQGALFLRRAHAVIVGLLQVATPPPTLERGASPEPALFRVDLRTELAAMLTALLHSMAARPRPLYSLSNSA